MDNILTDYKRLLQGEGEMADRTRSFKWSDTSAGPVEEWPQSLITTVNIILNTKFPMFLWWGEDLLQFYNDAYRPSFGNNGKHPGALGRPAIETWEEIWDVIKPLIDHVRNTGEAIWSEDQLIPIYRNDSLEDVYWTFGYSAVFNVEGKIGGVLVVCNETTNHILANKILNERKEFLEVALQTTEKTALNFRNLVIQTPVAMCILQGPQFVVEVANDLMCEIWGKNKEEVQGKPIFEGLPEARSQGLEELLSHVYFKGERIIAYERPVNLPRKGKQETVFLNFVYEPLKDNDGSVLGVMAVASDVTSQVADRVKIEESENKFRQLADSLPQMIWTAKPDGFVDYYNRQWYEFTGFGEKYGDDSWLPVIHPDEVSLSLAKYYHSIKTGEPFRMEYRFHDKLNGGYRWFLGQAQPIKDDQGNIIKWFGSFTDIDAQKSFSEKLEASVTERTMELQKMNVELQSFAYVASHDLQEPLRKIQTFSERIMDKEQPNLSESGKGYFKRLQSSAFRMQQFITDLLNYSRTNNNDQNVELTDLNKLFNEVISDLKDLIEKKDAVIELHLNCEAKVIPYQFRQVVQNLISNSLKFSSPKKVPLINISGEINKGKEFGYEKLKDEMTYCHIKFKDNGIGFEEQYRTRIFEMFQRLNGRSEFEGSGIGLAIVNKIMENHKGFITASGKPGEGASFDLYIPHNL